MGGKKKKKKIPLRKKPVSRYLLCMFAIFPVFCTDGYFNIRHDRYYFFLFISVAALVVQGVILLLSGSERKNLPHNLQAVHAARTGPWYRRLSFTDWAMLVFVAAAGVSTALSDYFTDSLYGTAGRNNGLILLLVYGGVYFMVSRCYVHREYVFAGLSLCSGFVSILALLNFFYLDPLGMFDQLNASDSLIFISTIGNKNLLSSYLCITLPATVSLFVHCEHKGLRSLYLICSALGFAALMCADSDSGFLGIGAFSLVGLCLYAREPGKLKRYLLALTLMLLAARLLQPVCTLPDFPNKGMGSLPHFFVFSPVMTGVLILLALITGMMYLLHWKKPQLMLPAGVRGILATALVAGGLTLVIGMLYYTFLDPSQPLDAPWNLLRLDDSWGTHRGFIWRRSMDIFSDFSWKEKLLGSGPDTFYPVFKPYFGELAQFGDTSTNAAHNEYIHYLITHGLVGLGAYLAVVIGSITQSLASAKKDPYALVFTCAVTGYSVQALVNIAQPITTPLLILFIALAARKLPEKAPKVPHTSYKKGGKGHFKKSS